MARLHVVIRAIITFAAIPPLLSQAEPQHHFDKAVFQTHENGTQSEEALVRNVHALRRFVWRHWLRRERGEATAKHSTVEGDSGTTIYRVEPDKSKLWRIVIESEGEETNFDEGTSQHYSKHKEAYKVVREEHHLLLQDKTGATVAEL